MEILVQKLCDWIEDRTTKAMAKGVIFGLSGGLDSAVVAVLSKKAFPKKSLALIMPCYSMEQDYEDAQELIKTFNINYKVIDLSKIYDLFSFILSGKQEEDGDNYCLAKANIKPRLRMITLYYFANKLNYLVVGTCNKSEIMVGYSTKYGDSGADILPLGNLLKSQVKELAGYLKVSKKIIEKPPSAGLWKGQTDEQELGITYAQIDEYLSKGKLYNKKIEEKIQKKIELSMHKQKIPEKPSF